jgi:trehalose/maltose hydrolase-like predicted phosphorylase
MYIPFDTTLGIHPEFDGYKGQTIKQADVVLLGSCCCSSRSGLADAAAGYPLQMEMDPAVRLADLQYYEQRTDPDGPAMTWGCVPACVCPVPSRSDGRHSMHAVALLDLGRPQDAAALFNRSYANVQAPFNVWFETPKGGAVNFLTGACERMGGGNAEMTDRRCTGAGGFLQGVVSGYGGVRAAADHLSMRPQLPESASLLAVRGVCASGPVWFGC